MVPLAERLLVWLVAALTFSAGLLAVARPIAERLPEKLADVLAPLSSGDTASYLFLGFGLSLMYLGYELLQRKRVAWLLAVILSAINFGLHAWLRPELSTALAAALALVVLFAARAQFYSRLHTDNLRRGLSLLAFSMLLALAYGTIGFWLLDKKDFGLSFSFGEAFRRTLRSYLLLGNSDLEAHTRYGRWFLKSLGLAGGLSLAYGLFSLFRPLKNRLRTLPSERRRARQLLEQYGGETDDFFKLWPADKSYFFSHDGEAFVAYGVARGIALCFAGPVGAPASIGSLLHDFKRFCRANGLVCGFAQTTNRFAKDFKANGFKSLLIGADAVIELDQFVNVTSRNKYFRNIMNRFEKQHFQAIRYKPPHSAELMREVQSVSNDWLRRAGRKQWRFFTGYFAQRYLQQMPLFTVRDSSSRLQAFVNELPSFKKGEATVDLMRHRRDVPTNLMDFLFVRLMQELKEDGYRTFNLGLSPMAAKDFAGESSGDKLLAAIYGSNQKIVSFEGLHRYKLKFEPQWQPRYLYYLGSTTRLPQIGLAVVKLIKY